MSESPMSLFPNLLHRIAPPSGPAAGAEPRQLAPKNDASIISTVASFMEDRHTGVCCTAVQASRKRCRRVAFVVFFVGRGSFEMAFYCYKFAIFFDI